MYIVIQVIILCIIVGVISALLGIWFDYLEEKSKIMVIKKKKNKKLPKAKVSYDVLTFKENSNELSLERCSTIWVDISWRDYFKQKWIKLLLWFLSSSLSLILLFLDICIWKDNGSIEALILVSSILFVGFFCYLLSILLDSTYVIYLNNIDKYNTNYYTGEEDKYEKYIIEKYFGDLLSHLNEYERVEISRAEEWRKKHPLEEKCRLALTKNPNYVADLIRHINGKGANDINEK